MFTIQLMRRVKTTTTVEPTGYARTDAEMRPITGRPRIVQAWLAGVTLRLAPTTRYAWCIPLGPVDLKIGWSRMPL